jgi:gas vesicle protein
MSTETKQIAKAAALVAGGAVVGAGLGLLFAPRSGVETRRQIRHYAKRAQVQANRFSRNLKAGYDQIVGRAEDKAGIEVGNGLVMRG